MSVHLARRSMAFSLVLPTLLVLIYGAGCSHTPTKTAKASSKPVLKVENKTFHLEDWVEAAETEYVAGHFSKATRLLETAFVQDSQGPDAAAADLLYYLYLSQGDYDRARRLAKALVKKNPYRSYGYYYVALAELWSGNTAQAVEGLRRCLEFSDHPARAHFYLGLAFGRQSKKKEQAKEFQDAEKEYRQILKKNPKDFEASFELAHLYLFWNVRPEAAEPLIENAKDSLGTPDVETVLVPALYRKHYLAVLEAMLETRRGHNEKALTLLWNTLQTAPDGVKGDLAEIYYYVALNYAALKQAPHAGSFFKKAVQVDPLGPYSDLAEMGLRDVASLKKTGK